MLHSVAYFSFRAVVSYGPETICIINFRFSFIVKFYSTKNVPSTHADSSFPSLKTPFQFSSGNGGGRERFPTAAFTKTDCTLAPLTSVKQSKNHSVLPLCQVLKDGGKA